MNTLLTQYLLEAGRTPFAYGVLDCCSWPCDWIVLHGYDDPMEDWRGRYDSWASVARLIVSRGGWLNAVSFEMQRVGLLETTDSMPGDVALIAHPEVHSMAIKTMKGWAWKADKAVFVHDLNPLRAWRVEEKLPHG